MIIIVNRMCILSLLLYFLEVLYVLLVLYFLALLSLLMVLCLLERTVNF